MHVWSFYTDVTANAEAAAFLMGSCAPRQVFVESFFLMCKATDETRALMESKCASGHLFESILSKMSHKLFNFFAKNKVNEYNSKQHELCKRKKDAGITAGDLKIKKLQSEQ